MTAHTVLLLVCDKTGCDQRVQAKTGESTDHLRRRAVRELGWRSWPSFEAGGHTDRCRWHS